MKIVAITGGIGSGKSTLSKYLKRKYPVYESDKAVSDLYKKPSKSFFNLIISCGLELAIKKNQIDKNLIKDVFFNNPTIKRKIQKHIHRELKTSRAIFIKKNKHLMKKIIFLDIPLLFENNLEKSFDYVVSIISSKKKRIDRVIKSKKFKKQTLNKILKSQVTDKERRARSDIIIINNKTKKDFIFLAKQSLTTIIK